MKYVVGLGLGVVLVAVVAGCGSSSTPGATITVYSGQHEETVTALVKAFTARTGIAVQVRSADEATLANQLLQEGSDTPADVFFAENPPALNVLDETHLLGPVAPATLANVSPTYSPSSGHWVGVSARVVA